MARRDGWAVREDATRVGVAANEQRLQLPQPPVNQVLPLQQQGQAMQQQNMPLGMVGMAGGPQQQQQGQQGQQPVPGMMRVSLAQA